MKNEIFINFADVFEIHLPWKLNSILHPRQKSSNFRQIIRFVKPVPVEQKTLISRTFNRII